MHTPHCLIAQSCLILCDSMDYSHPGPLELLCPWDFPGKHTGEGCHFLLQWIFLTQGLNLHLLHWQVDSLPLSHLGSLGPSLEEHWSHSWGLHLHDLITSQQPYLQITSSLGTRISTYKVEGRKHSNQRTNFEGSHLRIKPDCWGCETRTWVWMTLWISRAKRWGKLPYV